MNLGHPHSISGKRLLRATLGATVVLSLALTAGCERFKRKSKATEYTFDGIEFKTKAGAIEKDDRSRFQVEVRKAMQSIEGAKEAGRYAGTRYCIEQYGTSKIDWVVGGPDDENGRLSVVDGDLVMQGVCKP